MYTDVKLGSYIIRGENIVILGDMVYCNMDLVGFVHIVLHSCGPIFCVVYSCAGRGKTRPLARSNSGSAERSGKSSFSVCMCLLST